jgi:uncharacterized protein (UPF0371 family)
MIDPYHLDAYGVTTVNYNRDVEIFPVLNAIFEKIEGVSPYKSPTDMGVNMAGYAICDDEATSEASKQEIVRRYFNAMCDLKMGRGKQEAVDKIVSLMNQAGIGVEDRKVIKTALDRSAETDGQPAVAIELPDGKIVTGKTSNLLGASSAALLNALKRLGDIDDDYLLLPLEVIEPIQRLKIDNLGNHNPRLHADEILIALAISATTSELAAKAMAQLPKLKGCQAHSSVIPSSVDSTVYRKLGLNLTCEPVYATRRLYHK